MHHSNYFDKVFHAYELQKYPDGVTAKDANNKCGKAGMDPLVLINMTTVYSQELRTGLGIFIQFSPWIEIICELVCN